EARKPIWIARKFERQDLDGDIAPELAIVSAVHLAHAAGAKHRRDLKRSELTANERLDGRSGDHVLEGRCLEEASCCCFARKQALDIAPQFSVAVAGLVEKRTTGGWCEFLYFVKQVFKPAPATFVHGVCGEVIHLWPAQCRKCLFTIRFAVAATFRWSSYNGD